MLIYGRPVFISADSESEERKREWSLLRRMWRATHHYFKRSETHHPNIRKFLFYVNNKPFGDVCSWSFIAETSCVLCIPNKKCSSVGCRDGNEAKTNNRYIKIFFESYDFSQNKDFKRAKVFRLRNMEQWTLSVFSSVQHRSEISKCIPSANKTPSDNGIRQKVLSSHLKTRPYVKTKTSCDRKLNIDTSYSASY